MPGMVRVALALVLLAIAGLCAFLAVAAREALPGSWWAFWLLYGVVGGGCLLGALWLLWPRRART
jgi:hypothetical protein